MKQFGTVVYLRVSWPVLDQRLLRSSGRPLADPGQGMEPVRQLWQSRLAWYEEADLIVDADRLSIGGVIRQIVENLGLEEIDQCPS